MPTQDKQALEAEFPKERLQTRQGAGNQTFTYVPKWDVTDRLIRVTENEFDWRIHSCELIPAMTREMNGKTITKPAFWIARGTLTLPGLGSRDGVGTQPAETEDSPKGACTDAFKVAATLFGVALYLYEKEDNPAQKAAAQKAQREEKNGHATTNPKQFIKETTVALGVSYAQLWDTCYASIENGSLVGQYDELKNTLTPENFTHWMQQCQLLLKKRQAAGK